jgi:hypothetical protein
MSTSETTIAKASAEGDEPTAERPLPGRPKSPWLSIGEHGWSIHFPPYQEGTLHYGVGSLSHYGDTWREHLDDLTADALGTDTRTIPDEDIVRFALSGPLGDVTLPAGHVAHLLGATERWQDVPTAGRDPRFGNAGSLDRVALDVYVIILRRFGGRVFDPHRENGE